MSQTWGFKPKWMVNASIEHRQVIKNTCWRNIREMCCLLDHAYDYVLPEEKEKFNAWQMLYRHPGERSHRPPHWRSHRNANTAQAPPDTVSEQLTEQEANLKDAFEGMMDETVLDGLREFENVIQDNGIPRTFSLQNINVNQDIMDTSNSESTTLEEVFQLEADDEHEEGDTDLDSSFSWGDADFSLDNESQLEDSIVVQATSQPDDDYISSDIASQMDDVTSTMTDETSDLSSQPEDEHPDLNVSLHGEEEKSTPNVVPQQDLTVPEALRDRMPGLLRTKLERNAILEHVLTTMMNQPSLKPAARGAQPVPQDYKETYDKAIIQIEELKGLWYCVLETQRYVLKFQRNLKHACKDLDHKACVYRHRSKVAPDYQIQRMRSKGQASRLNECIGIDEPWPEGE